MVNKIDFLPLAQDSDYGIVVVAVVVAVGNVSIVALRDNLIDAVVISSFFDTALPPAWNNSVSQLVLFPLSLSRTTMCKSKLRPVLLSGSNSNVSN